MYYVYNYCVYVCYQWMLFFWYSSIFFFIVYSVFLHSSSVNSLSCILFRMRSLFFSFLVLWNLYQFTFSSSCVLHPWCSLLRQNLCCASSSSCVIILVWWRLRSFSSSSYVIHSLCSLSRRTHSSALSSSYVIHSLRFFIPCVIFRDELLLLHHLLHILFIICVLFSGMHFVKAPLYQYMTTSQFWYNKERLKDDFFYLLYLNLVAN